MKTGVYESIENLNSELERCNDCCSGDYLSYHCPLCPVWKYKPRQKSKLLQHLLVHWRTAVQGHDELQNAGLFNWKVRNCQNKRKTNL